MEFLSQQTKRAPSRRAVERNSLFFSTDARDPVAAVNVVARSPIRELLPREGARNIVRGP